VKRPTVVFGKMLEELDTARGRITSYTLYALNIMFFGLYILGTYQFAESFTAKIRAVEFLLAAVFLFEYLSRIDFAEDTWAEVKNPYSMADLLALLPALLIPVLPALGQATFIRSIQILRVLRFLRIGLEDDRFFNYDIKPRQVVIVELLILIFVILTVHAGAIHGVESGTNPEIENFGDSMYYSVVALTTTGFGNVVPQTDTGRFLTSFGLIAAVTLIPWLVVRARNKQGINTECTQCYTSRHLENSNYCWRCGNKL